MHTQDAKRDMALEIKLRNPWGATLARSVHPSSERDCSHARTMAGWNKLAKDKEHWRAVSYRHPSKAQSRAIVRSPCL